MLILEKLFPDRAVISSDEGSLEVPIECVKGCSEGDVLIEKGGIFISDLNETEKRRKQITALQNSLWE